MPIYRGTGGSGDASTDAYASQVAEYANTATVKANAAAASAAAAASSASAAATSVTNATNEANAAATSAAAALASASNAATSESNASTFANNASTFANNAAASFDQFDDIYLGAKASAPTLDNDGDPLQTGAIYFNTTVGIMYVYNGSAWEVPVAAVNGTSERYVYTATGGQTTFAVTYDVGFVDVYLNGVKLVVTTDFTATSGTNIVLTTGATAGDIVDIIAYGAFEVANTYTQAQVDTKLLEVEGTEIVSTGVSAGFYLAADGDNTSSWQQVVSPYNDWSVKTTTYTAVNKDQLACNGTFTVTLPATPSVGDTVVIANVGAGVVTVGRNGSNINSLAEDGTLNADTSTQLVYIDGTIGWKEI